MKNLEEMRKAMQLKKLAAQTQAQNN